MLIVDKDENVFRSKDIAEFNIGVKLGANSEDDLFILGVRLKSQQGFKLGEYNSFFEARYEYEKIQAAIENGEKVYVIE